MLLKIIKSISLARSSSDLENVTDISVDLSNLSETENTFTKLLKELASREVTSITLINNAGRIGEIANLENLEATDIAKNHSVKHHYSTCFIEYIY